MNLLKYTVLGGSGLIVLFIVTSFALPNDFKVERSVEINAPMDVVYPLVYDPKAWPRWGVWNRRDPGMQFSYSGAPAGVGAKWAWQSRTEGSGRMEITAADFNQRIAYKVAFGDYEGESAGRLEFAPAGKGVQVTWIAEGNMGKNPLMRYFALMMDRMVGPDFEGGLKNLKELAEKRP